LTTVVWASGSGIPQATASVAELSFAPAGHVQTFCFSWNKVSTPVAPLPTGLVPSLDNLIKFPILWTIFSCWMSVMFAHEADSRVAFAACDIQWIFRVQFLARWNELATGRIRTEYPRLPRRTVLDYSLQKLLLGVAAEQISYYRAGQGLGTAPWGHTRFIRHGCMNE